MFKPLSLKCFLAFLAFKGFKLDRIASSHHIYKKQGGKRSVVIQGNAKEIPALHIKTNCRTIGCTTDEIYEWAEENC